MKKEKTSLKEKKEPSKPAKNMNTARTTIEITENERGKKEMKIISHNEKEKTKQIIKSTEKDKQKKPKTMKSQDQLATNHQKAQEKTAKSVIDEIFASKKSKTEKDALDSQQSVQPSKQPFKKQKNRNNNDEDDFADTRGLGKKTRPMTDDGYFIYTAEEMNVGKGGSTDNCPFDCDCCF